MKKRTLTLLMGASLSALMMGCKTNANVGDSDKELSNQLTELNGYVQGTYKKEKFLEKEIDENLVKSKVDSLSINRDTLEFGDIYLVNKNDINVLVFGIKHYKVFPEDTIISFYGISNGEEKLLDEYNMDMTERRGFGLQKDVRNSGGMSINVPAILKLDGVIETMQTCCVDWDGYDSYRVDIRMEDGDIFEPRVLDTASYTIDNEDLIRLTEDEFVKRRMDELMKSLENNQCENDKLLVKYMGADITSAGYSDLTVTIENKGNTPISQCRVELEIMDSYYKKCSVGSLNNGQYIQVNPGEVKKFVKSQETNIGLKIESGKEYIVRVFIYDVVNDETIMDSYLKSNFR